MQKQMSLDETDLAILRCLQARGKITHRELAEVVGLSPSRCCERVQRLEGAGVIAGYRPIIDWKKFEGGFSALAEIIIDGDMQTCDSFAEFIGAFDVVAAGYRLAQPHVFILSVTAITIMGWREFLTEADRAGFRFRVSQLSVVLELVAKPCFVAGTQDVDAVR